MSKSLKVVYEDGVFKPLQKINLKEHQKLELVIKKVIKDTPSPKQQSPIRLIGLFESDIIDLGVNNDSCFYDHSK